MGKKKKYDLSELDGVEKLFNDSVDELAHEVLWKIENIYESAIEKFYNDYTPLYYNRTGATWYGSSGADTLFSPQNIYANGNNWTAGIQVDPSFIPGNPYRADKDWVFKRTFNAGLHGINTGKSWGKNKEKTYSKVIGKKVFEVIYGKSVNGKSITKKKKKFYEGDIKLKQSVMQNMSPTPRGIMSREFKALTKKKNLKKMFNDILESKL